MRAFLAFDLAPDVVGRLVAAQAEIRETGADLSVVGRGNIHLTVKFLGEVPESVVTEIDRRIESLELLKMEASLRGLGAFPDATRPRVVWAGTGAQDESGVVQRAEAVIGTLKGIGQEEDRKFHAHVTLARVRSPRRCEALTELIRRNADRDFGTTGIEFLKLKSSILTPKGPVYTEIRRYPLR